MCQRNVAQLPNGRAFGKPTPAHAALHDAIKHSDVLTYSIKVLFLLWARLIGERDHLNLIQELLQVAAPQLFQLLSSGRSWLNRCICAQRQLSPETTHHPC